MIVRMHSGYTATSSERTQRKRKPWRVWRYGYIYLFFMDTQYSIGWLRPVSLSRVLPLVPSRKNLGILVFCGGITLCALPFLLCKGPLYMCRGISKQGDVQSLDSVPSIVGTGLPVASN